MNIRVVQEPQVEALSLEEVKAYLCIDESVGDEADQKLTSLIKAGREAAESFTNTSISLKILEIAFDEQIGALIDLPKDPLKELVSVKMYSKDDEEVEIPTSDFYVDLFSSRIALKDTASLPSVSLRRINGVIITYKAGYEIVPEEIKQAILIYIKGIFESIPPQDFMPAFERLLYPYKVVRV